MSLMIALALISAPTCLAYQRGDGGSPVVQASVNGREPLFLVLDTAASGSTLDAQTIAALDLPRDSEMETAQGLGGPLDVHIHEIAALDAGPVHLKDLRVAGSPAPRFASHAIAGLAGIDLFGSALAIWNAVPGCVDLAKSGARAGGADWRRIAIHWIRPWKIMIPIRIGRVDGWGLLDTGAQYTVLNGNYARRLGLTPESGRLRAGGEIWGLDARPIALSRAEVEGVRIGAWTWPRRSLKIGDLPVFDRLGDPAAPLAIIGADWLMDRAFAIDYGTRTVWQKAR